jgi:hypothetical protein
MSESTPPNQKRPEKAEEQVSPTKGLDLRISDDRMTARIYGKLEQAKDAKAVQDAITLLLKTSGVKHGIVVSNVRKAIEILTKGGSLDGLVVAEGTKPSLGQDARIEQKVKIETSRIGRLTEAGHIDFRDKGPLPLVEPGTILAELIPAVQGKLGCDILGKKLKPPKVRRQRIRGGKGSKLEQEGQVVVAAVQGLVTQPEPDKFEVMELYEVHGDVDFHTGHIEFPGMVRVTGAVLNDFKVKAKNVEVNELEPGSMVEASESLTVLGGIMGATVNSGGKMTARFVRDSKVIAKGDVVVESEIVQSLVKTEGKVIISQSEGRIVNSKVSAVRGVTTGDVISSGTDATRIEIGASAEYEQKVHNLRKLLADLDKEEETLTQSLEMQKEELKGAEDELRGMLAALKDPEQEANRTNLLAQVDMVKPIRAGLMEEVKKGSQRLEDIYFERQLAMDKLKEIESLLHSGNVYLDVRGSAAPTTEIKCPRSRLTLSKKESNFSAREIEIEDRETGDTKILVKVGQLRSGI